MRIRFIVTLMLFAVGAFFCNPIDSHSQQPFGRGSFDPDKFFDTLSSGGSTIKIAQIPFGRDQAQEWATKNGITNGEFTRDQYKKYTEERAKSGGGLFGGGGGGFSFNPDDLFNRYSKDGKTVRFDATRDPSRIQKWATDNGIKTDYLTKEQWADYAKSWTGGSRSSGSSTPPSTTSPDQKEEKKDDKSSGFGRGFSGGRGSDRGGFDANRVDEYFRRWDRNGNGFLEFEEMSETLQAEKDNWDANKDGLIDGNEFRDYMKAWHEKRQAERGENTGSSSTQPSNPDHTPGSLPPGTHGSDAPSVDLDKKVFVLRAGKLGDKMPSWFADYDVDNDAQIALYEWKEKGGELSKFREWDVNEDGFITPDEVMRVSALASAKDVPSASSSSDKASGSMSRGPSSSGSGGTSGSSRGNFFASMFGKRDNGQGTPGSSRGGPPSMGGGLPGTGGGGSMSDSMFDRVAKGRSSFNITEADSRMQASLTEFAKKKGITDGTITKESFKEYWASRELERGDRGSSFGSPGSSSRRPGGMRR